MESASPTTQSHHSNDSQIIKTSGGANVAGDVNLGQGDFVGRDKIIHGDEVRGDKVIYTGDQAYDVLGLANPYLGLKAFTYAERTRYAGREQDVDRAVAMLTKAGAERTLLFITGASGSGKSSFAHAGLIPGLESRYQEQGFAVKWAVFRPGEQPLAELARALHTLELPVEGVFEPAADYQLSVPVESPDSHQISLLLIDQFEELFSQSDPAQREIVFQLLTDLPLFKISRLHVIATLRADYLPDLFAYKTLYDTAKTSIDLRVMSEDELKVAIQRPLQDVHPNSGRRFQTALLNQLAEDAAEDATYLPLLQVTLEDLWRGGILTIDHYGSLTDAIRKRADEIYKFKMSPDGTLTRRSPTEQQLMLDIFLDLVDVSFEDDVRRDVRRTRRLADVTKGNQDAEALIHELVAGRLLATDEKEVADSDQEVETVDIIHESLIQNWARLSSVIQEQREWLQQRRRFELRLDEWLDSKQSKMRLLSGVQLEEAIQLRKLEDVAVQAEAARSFIEQSIQERDRNRRRNQRITTVVVAALLLLLGIAIAAILGQIKALEAEEAQRSVAEQSAIINLSQSVTDAELRLRLPLEAIRLAKQQEMPPQPEAIRELLRGFTDAPILAERIAVDHDSDVRGLTFDSENRWISFDGNNPGTAQLFDLQKGQLVDLPLEIEDVNSFHFLPGSELLIADAWPNIYVINSNDLTIHCSLPHDERGLSYQDLNADDRMVLTADDHALRLWTIDACVEIGRIPFARNAEDIFEADIFFNANHTQVIAVLDNSIYRWDLTAPDAPVALETQEADQIILNSDKSQLLLLGANGSLRLDTTSSTVEPVGLAVAKLELGTPMGILSPDGRYLWTTQSLLTWSDVEFTLWDVETGAELHTIKLKLDSEFEQVSWVPRTDRDLLLVRTDKRVFLYAAETGDPLPSPPGYRGTTEVRHAEVDPSGQWLVIELAGRLAQGMIEVWEIEGNVKIAEYGYNIAYSTPIAYSPDGQLIAVLGDDPTLWTSTLRVWELPSLLETYDLFAGPTTVFALNTQGDRGRTLIDATSNEPLAAVPLAPDPRAKLKPSKTAGWLLDHSCAVDSTDCWLNLWDLNQEVPLLQHRLPCDDNRTGCPSYELSVQLVVSKNGRWLVAPNYFDDEVAEHTGIVAIWDLESGERLPNLQHDEWIEAIALNPVAPQLATIDSDGIVRLWNLEGDATTAVTLPLEYMGVVPYPALLAFTPDGKRLISTAWEASGIGALIVSDAETLETLEHYVPDDEQEIPGVSNFALAPDGASIFVVLQMNLGGSRFESAWLPGQQIQRWELDGLKIVGKSMIIDEGEVLDIAFSHSAADSGLLMATASSDGLVRVWNAETGDLLLEVPHDVSVKQVVFAPDEKGLFTVDVEGTLHTWPIDFTAARDDVYGLLPLACQRLSRDFTEGEWEMYFGDREREESLCPEFELWNK